MPNKRKTAKVMVVAGTRPEVIKIAPVIKKLQSLPDNFETIFVATAQHRELLDQALSLFNIKPDIDLNLMSHRQSLHELTSRVIEKMSATLSEVKPDIVMVQGDTTTVFASVLSAYYQKIPVAHVEAGLRSYNKYSPFPEEMNRRLTTAITDIHFAPTLSAKNALLKESISADKIVVTGNTVVDALMHISQIPFKFNDGLLKGLDFRKNRLVLVTSHRRESWGTELENICCAIKELVNKYSDIIVVYPVHPNPVVKETAQQILSGNDRIFLVDPLDYITFVNLMKNCYIILTDSGGLQEEAPTLKKPLLLLRNVTERPEAFNAGLAKIVGTDRLRIIKESEKLLNDVQIYKKMTDLRNPYGDGKAAERIVDSLIRWAKGENNLLKPCEEFDPQKV
jgi:UDP-N-acetylglucosamine 2-epimerase (non-hydrolysing)